MLPWELWDEISRLRIEVEPVEQERLDAALRPVRGDRPRSRRLALRRRRARRRERAGAPEEEEGDPIVILFIAVPVLMVGLIANGVPAWIVVSGAASVVWTAFSITRSLDEGERRVALLAKRRHRKKGRRRTRATVLAVSAPRLVPGTQSTWRRVVTLYTGDGQQRSFLSDAAIELSAGDVVTAAIDGIRLVDTEQHGRIELEHA